MTNLSKAFVVLAMLASGSIQAEQISIVNASFEDQPLAQGAWTYPIYGPITGWTGDNWAGGVWRPYTDLLMPSDGSQVGFSNGEFGPLSQTLTAVLKANTQYTLQVDLINRMDTSTNQSSTVELLAGGHVLASSTIVGGVQGSQVLQTVSFLSGSSGGYLGQSLGIALLSGGQQSDWDNVRLVALPVPEPETYAMLLAGLGLLGLAARRRKHQQDAA